MIPVSLQMRNFLSYGENVPPLDFSQFDIACLSGRNGQGKSALLDAITWAIWGEGRKPSQERKADSGLLKIGENQMWVDLIFDLEGERYRIIRKFSKLKSKNHSELELQIFDEQKSDYISLSSTSIRQTQQKINRLLRMDYNTFVNSAFILQGRVDEFTRKTARERKQILSEVLGLSHYDALSVLARQHLRKIEGEIINLKNRIEQIRVLILQKDSLEDELCLLQENENSLKLKIKATSEKIQKLEEQRNRLDYEQDRAKDLEKHINFDEKELRDYIDRGKIIKGNIKDYSFMISQEKQILADYDKYLALYNKNQLMIGLMQQYRQLDRKKREIESKIEKIKNYLVLKWEQKKYQYQELQEKIKSLPDNQKEIQKYNSKIKNFDELGQRQECIQQEGNQLNIKIESKNNQLKRIKDEIKKNQEKMNLLSQGKQKYCPLCNSPLNDQKKETILNNTKKEIDLMNQEIIILSEEITGLSSKKNLLQDEWKKIRDTLKDKNDVQNNLARLNFALNESRKAVEQAKDLTKEIKKIYEELDKELFAQNERIKLREIEKQINMQDYDEKSHIKINQELKNLNEIPLQKEKLSEAKRRMVDLKKYKLEIDRQIESKGKKVLKLKKEYQETVKKASALPELVTLLEDQRESLIELQEKYNQLFQKKGICQERLRKIGEYQKEENSIEKQKNSYLHEKEVYQKLTDAFGRNGIQSMIIENAIPELENEANAILSQLSSDRTTISLESLKELKSGESRETLDIKIHDEMGIRAYELYSGGETFRIDFAIRIALSKLLTYRTGARLRTLIIDEGFGTQDEEGLQKLIQAIHSIKNDFDKILVITHLPLLKDAFPVRIEVWKDPALGSQFELIHL